MEDEDLHRNIKRAEFEEMMQPMATRFSQVLEEAIALSGKFNFLLLQVRVDVTNSIWLLPSYTCYNKLRWSYRL